MIVSARKARKDLSANALFRLVRSGFDAIADSRAKPADISLGDALMSGFAMFSLKDPSLLAFDNRRQNPNDNFRTIYGIRRVPSDTQMRAILDPVAPDVLRPLFGNVFHRLQRGKALEAFVYLDGHYLLSLDGTTYFSSSKIHCSSCLEKHHRGGGVTYSHQVLGATLVHPDLKEVIPLAPEPIIPDARVQYFSWITDFVLTPDNVYAIMRGGRARWKIENETFNTLKNQGYHLEHNYGHGQKNLSVVLALLMMLAFLVDQTQQLCCPVFQAARAKCRTKHSLWEKIRKCFDSFRFASMTDLLWALAQGIERQPPVLCDST